MSRLRRRRIAAFGTAFLLPLGATVVLAAEASAAPVTASCVKTQNWGSGFEGRCTVTNGTGAAITTWQVEFDLPTGTAVGAYWDALMTAADNHYTFSPRSWNGTVSPGATVSFGFIGTGSGNFANCKVNGAACDGSGGGGDTQAPSVPGNLRSTGKTATSVSLAWDASTDNTAVAGYDVYNGTTRATTVTGTTAAVTGLTANTAYTFTVRAKDAAGNTSAASAPVSVTTSPTGGGDTQAPTVPGNLRSTGKTAGSVSLAWNASTDNVRRHRVRRVQRQQCRRDGDRDDRHGQRSGRQHRLHLHGPRQGRGRQHSRAPPTRSASGRTRAARTRRPADRRWSATSPSGASTTATTT